MNSMRARYTPRFGKRFTSLEEGEATVEAMHGSVKIMVQNSKGNQFWIFVDPVDLAQASLAAVPVVRVREVSNLEAFVAMTEALEKED